MSNLVNCQGSLTEFCSTGNLKWNLIVISARDEHQASVFQKQIEFMKRCNNHVLHPDLNFLVIPDSLFKTPSNVDRFGAGASTINIFKLLVSKYGADVFDQNKILLIHCGGYSKRLPHYGFTGKIFSHLPIKVDDANECQLWTALEVKLALIAPFADRMKSGVWIAASDDVVTYEFDGPEFEAIGLFDQDMIVALGHPSSLEIAQGHGVYVLEQSPKNLSASLLLSDCIKVLQKPTENELFSQGAVIESDNESFSVTDSSYYIGAEVIKQKLLHFDTDTLQVEMDVYGHFLCPLGQSPITKDLEKHFYSPLSQIFEDVPFKVLFLPKSKFYHLGTLREYLYALTDFGSKTLAKELCFSKPEITQFSSINGTIICCMLNRNSNVDKHSFLEFCNFKNIPIETDNNILYNCSLEDAEENLINIDVLKFPANFLFYSLPVNVKNQFGWCTIFCHIDAQLKSSLWQQKSFSFCPTRSQSLISTLNIVKGCDQVIGDVALNLSLSDAIEATDIHLMIDEQIRIKESLFNQTK